MNGIDDGAAASHHDRRLTRERYLALTDSIVYGPIKISPGDFCGAVLNKVYTLADAANFAGADLLLTAANRTATYQVSEYVVKYKTQIREGTVIDATGIVMLPMRGKAIPGGHPVLLYGHGTVGIDDADAPSATIQSPNAWVGFEYSILRNYTAIGFVVVAPDYAGLGIFGVPHYYLVKFPIAYSMIDGVRSALVFGKNQGLTISRNTALMGHSQGGQAVLFTLEVYDGPEAYGKSSFDVKIVVPLAPAGSFRYNFYVGSIQYGQTIASFLFMYLYAAVRYNSNLTLDVMLSPSAINTTLENVESLNIDQLIDNNVFPVTNTEYFAPLAYNATLNNLNGFICFFQIFGFSGLPGCVGGLSPFDLTDFTLDPIPAEWQAQIDEDSSGFSLVSKVPIRLINGNIDQIVSPLLTLPIAQKLAMNGANLVDETGTTLTLDYSFFASEYQTLFNCTSPGYIIQCGYGHDEIIGAVDQYVPVVLSKVGLQAVPSEKNAKVAKKAGKKQPKKAMKMPLGKSPRSWY